MRRSCFGLSALLLVLSTGLRADPPAPSREGLPAGVVARLGAARLRHTGPVLRLVFSPDGRSLYSIGTEEKVVRAWDVTTGQEVRRFVQEDAVHFFALSPHGKILATGTDDTKSFRLWDTITGKERKIIRTDRHHFTFAFTPDGRTLFSGGGPLNSAIGRWDVATGKELPGFVRYKAFWSEALAFSPDGKLLATTEGNALIVWDVASGKRKYTRPTGILGGLRDLAFARDGRLLVGACGSAVVVWDTATGRQRHHMEAPGGTVFAVALAADAKSFTAACYDHTVRIWDMATGRELHVLRGHTGPVQTVAFSPDGRLVASGGQDRFIRLWDAKTGRQVISPSGPEGPIKVFALAPDGRTVATAKKNMIHLWDVASGQERRRLIGRNKVDVAVLAFAPDGRLLASGDVYGIVRLWDVRTGRELRHGAHLGSVAALAFAPDGRSLVSTGYFDGLKLWEVPTGAEAKPNDGPRAWTERRALTPPNQPMIFHLAFLPDGRKVVVWSDRPPGLTLWDLKTGKLTPVGDAEKHWGYAQTIGVTPDGRTLVGVFSETRGGGMFIASEPQPGRVWRWDLRDGKERNGLQQLKGAEVSITWGRLSPDGRSVATIGKDGMVRLWELATGRQRHQWKLPAGMVVTGGDFTADSRLLALTCTDGTVLFWSLQPAAPPGKSKKR